MVADRAMINTFIDKRELESLAAEAEEMMAFDPYLKTRLSDGDIEGLKVWEYGRLLSSIGSLRGMRVLDVGPGDGLLIAGALRHVHLQPLPAFDLVEPAADLLSKTLAKLSQHTPPVEAQGFNGTIQQFVDHVPPESHWDLCQATWSLHNLSPTDRAPIFRWLSERCTTLLIAEFDVHAEHYPLLSRQRVRLVHDKYLAGVAEYTGHLHPALEEQVKQGFLMPIMFGYFRSDASRSTCEQPIQAWSAEIRDVGFGTVRRELIYHYWWADAYLLIAQA